MSNFLTEFIGLTLRTFMRTPPSYEQWQAQVQNIKKQLIRPKDRLFWIASILILAASGIELDTGLQGVENWLISSKFSALHHSGAFWIVLGVLSFCSLSLAVVFWAWALVKRIILLYKQSSLKQSSRLLAWVFLVVAVCVQLYAILSTWSANGVNAFDLAGYHAINGLAGHNHLLDVVMRFFAKDALEIYAVLFLVAWFAMPKTDIKNRHALVVAGFSGIFALLMNVVISHVWFRPRPFAVLPKGSFTQLIPHGTDASFPSDHTSGSFGFASASWGTNQRWISWTFTILAVIVMFARVYVGVHWLTDVIAGLIVGTFSGRIMWRFSRFLYPLTIIAMKICRFKPQAKSTSHGLSM